MGAVVVIEPYVLLRLGIMQQLADALPETRVQGVDYAALSVESTPHAEIDLVLLSVALSQDVIELVQMAQRVYTPKWMILLSDADTMPSTWRNLPEVISGYVSRNTSPEVLTASIRLVMVGGKCFQSSNLGLSGSAPDTVMPAGMSGNISPLPLVSDDKALPCANSLQDSTVVPALTSTEAQMLRITPRQYEVLVLLARGYPIKTVSRQLNISVATAKAHAETLYQRLDAHNRNEAVYTAVARGATLGWAQLKPSAQISRAAA